MQRRSLTFLSSLVLTVAALSAAAALGTANGTDRPVKVQGKSTETVSIDLATGLGSGDGRGFLSQIGKVTFHDEITSFTFTGPDTFSFSGTQTIVAANGDKLFATAAATGGITSTGLVATVVNTITGGTGGFADASGTIKRHARDNGRIQVGSVVTSKLRIWSSGRIRY
jgi:hypothetical protein